MTAQTTREMINQYIPLIAPINSVVASQLTELSARIAAFEAKFGAVEQRVISLNTTDPAVLAADQQIIDLNQGARDTAALIYAAPIFTYGLIGTVRFASLIYEAATVTESQIAFGAVRQSVGPTLLQFLSEAWNIVSIEVLPPYEQGNNGLDLFIGNIDGGRADLLAGNDVFIPNATDEAYNVNGGSGDDVIFGSTSGEDSIKGDTGNDTIIAANGVDVASGGDNNDWLQVEGQGGGFYGNNIKGDKGQDTIIGSGYSDSLFGSDSHIAKPSILSDTDSNYVIGRGGSDVVNGGVGNDYLIGDNFADSASASEKSLFAGFISGVASKIGASGASGNDRMVGYAGHDVMAGGGGNDTLYGDDDATSLGLPGGNDTLFGDAGIDSLLGGQGDDKLVGGVGQDNLNGGDDNDVLWGGEGVISKDKNHEYNENDGGTDDGVVDVLIGGKGQDTIYAGKGDDISGNDDNDYIYRLTGAGTATLAGGTGSDHLYGSWGNDSIYGGDDSDSLSGGGGNDHLIGGKGADIYDFSNGAFVDDATTEDFISWAGGMQITGGVQQWWMEGGWAYYAPISSIADLGGFFPEFLAAVSVVTDLSVGPLFRFGLTETNQLIIQSGRGRTGQMVIENYQLDLEEATATANVVAFKSQHLSGEQATLSEYKDLVGLTIKAGFGYDIPNGDPLIVDLGGNGLDLTRQRNSNVYFDFDGDGFAENMAWVKPANDNQQSKVATTIKKAA